MSVEIKGDGIVGEIEIAAAPEKVFDALTDPEQLAQWWGSADTYRTSNWKLDLRPGGEWSCDAKGSAGPSTAVAGRYVVVDRPHHLSYTWRPSWAPGEESQVTYTFEPIGTGTRVLFRHDGFLSDQSRQGHSQGWARVTGWLQGHFQQAEVAR
ncbi:MAG TPA: SRPBCC domain-containing protein [Candidatus Sulfopaludibacter sp.]|jgi:uncharacterized protein YndB with AHSA1/START domain|nr:SRPBCC domain-containing protein [Candidatus Sulfopaludibacter sp.]